MNKIIDIKFTQVGSTEPVLLADAKLQAIVDHANDNTYITSLITRCRKEMENMCGISIVEREVVLIADWDTEQRLPYGPVDSVDDVEIKLNNEWESVDSDDWHIDGDSFSCDRVGRLKITYTSVSTVTEDMKAALLSLIAYRYENRGDHSGELSGDVMSQILQHKDYSWA